MSCCTSTSSWGRSPSSRSAPITALKPPTLRRPSASRPAASSSCSRCSSPIFPACGPKSWRSGSPGTIPCPRTSTTRSPDSLKMHRLGFGRDFLFERRVRGEIGVLLHERRHGALGFLDETRVVGAEAPEFGEAGLLFPEQASGPPEAQVEL